jgi:hypothetical protein
VFYPDYTDEHHAPSISDEVGENGNKLKNNKTNGFDLFCEDLLDAVLYLRDEVQVLTGEYGKIMNMS